MDGPRDCFCGCGRQLKRRRGPHNVLAHEISGELDGWAEIRDSFHAAGREFGLEDFFQEGLRHRDDLREFFHSDEKPASLDLKRAGTWNQFSRKRQKETRDLVDELVEDAIRDESRPVASYSLALNDAASVRSELDAIGEGCLKTFGADAKDSDLMRRAMSKETATAFVGQLPLVERMLAIELDPDRSGELGLGRVNKHDAPPRTGDKLRKQLQQDGAVETVGRAMEMLLLAGFSAQAGLTTDPALAQGRSPDDVWRLWNTSSFAFYAETDLAKVLFLDLDEAHEPSVDLDFRVFADRGLNAYVEAGEQYGFIDFNLSLMKLRKATKTGRAMTFAYFAVSSGRALHRSLTEAVGE